MKKLFSVVFVLCSFLFTGANAYDRAHIENRSLVGGKITVKYSLCRTDTFDIAPGRLEKGEIISSYAHAPTSRGQCLITSISLSYWKNHAPLKISDVNSYKSSGTSYSRFIIVPRSPSRYRIMSSHELGRENKDAKMSPGFRIHNRTHLPLSISLDQIGCLYYQNKLLPGQIFDRNTGGVWFTINAKIYDPNSPKTNDFTCALPIVTTTISALAAVAVGPSMAAQWATSFIAQQGATQSGKQLMAKLNKSGQVRLMGQYAGPPWPGRCTHKPEYEIVGGPRFDVKASQNACREVKSGKYQRQIRLYDKQLTEYRQRHQRTQHTMGLMAILPEMVGIRKKTIETSTQRYKVKLQLEHAEELCGANGVDATPLKINHINQCGG